VTIVVPIMLSILLALVKAGDGSRYQAKMEISVGSQG
jgi:hypothetical protein